MDPQVMILIRGIPGSGKTTTADNLMFAMENSDSSRSTIHVEADMYFINSETGVYEFDKSKIGNAHGWCLACAKEAIDSGKNVIVSNTFVQQWEMKPYISLAQEAGANLQIIEVTGFWESVHKVPQVTIELMKSKWEHLDRSEIRGWQW